MRENKQMRFILRQALVGYGKYLRLIMGGGEFEISDSEESE